MRIAITANLKKGTTASASSHCEAPQGEAAAGPKQSQRLLRPSGSRNGKGGLWDGETEEEFDSLETVEAIRCALESAGHESFYLPADQTLPFVLNKNVILRAKPEESQILRGVYPRGAQILRGVYTEPSAQDDGRSAQDDDRRTQNDARRRAQDDKLSVDFVFNIAEGFKGRSREAHVPALLEMAGIPYSGSDPLALALTLDKGLAKWAALGAGVPTADFIVIPASCVIPEIFSRGSTTLDSRLPAGQAGLPAGQAGFRGNDKAAWGDDKSPPFPLFVKPAWEGSSKGIRRSSRVDTAAALAKEVERIRSSFPDQPVLVERYLPGPEFTVGILGNDPPKVLGVMEIKSQTGKKDFVYSLETKRRWREEVHYECPPKNLNDTSRKTLESMALGLYEAFGCRDVARFDFRMDEKGKPYFLEANPLPGLNPESGDLVIMARQQGWEYDKLILAILDAALKRSGR